MKVVAEVLESWSMVYVVYLLWSSTGLPATAKSGRAHLSAC